MIRHTLAAAAVSIVVACGSASAADLSGGQPASMSAASVARIASSLRLQPGDLAAMSAARPLAFSEVAGNQEFSSELIVRARRQCAIRAMSRLTPAMVKKSQFVDEAVVRVPDGVSEGEFAAALMATGDYEYAEPNWVLFPLATTPNDPQFSSSWQHTRMQSTLAWDITQGSPDVIVAVCDSGVDIDHPDLAAALVPGYNAVNNLAQVDGGLVDDVNGHGTFVAGCAAAIGNNGTGVVGVGWNMRIMPVRVSNNSSGTANPFDLLEGARWAASNGAKAVNVSFTGATSSGTNAAARDVKNMGGLLLWASGNDGTQSSNGYFPDLTIVGSTTSSDSRSGFSNYGTAIDVVAPGSGVRSTQRGGGYGNSSGTSFASPMAAGVVGMIFSANPALGPDDVQDILYSSADDLGSAGYDIFYGHGRVNTFNAVTMAQSYTPRLTLPLFEDFESADWQTVLSGGVGTPELIVDPGAPSGTGALALDAGESVESAPIAGLAAFNAGFGLSVKARAEGVPAFETLSLQYRDEAGVWHTVDQAVSAGGDGAYVLRQGALDNDFAYHSSAVRLVANNTSGRWIIDDLAIGEMDGLGLVPFADGFDDGVIDPARWTDVSDAAIAIDQGDFVMAMGNDATASTVNLPLLDLQALDQSAWLVVTGQGLTSGDSLAVEIRSEFLAWTTLGTIDVSGVDATPRGFEFEVPDLAVIGTQTQLRLTASTAGGTVFVDDVHIGTTRLPDLDPGCSDADLAEPYGLLNIFDIQAYIGLYNSQDPAADLAAPFGVFNIFDLQEYINRYNAGCP